MDLTENKGAFPAPFNPEKKLAVLLPTRYRPEIFARMLASWKETSEMSDLIVGLQADDENAYVPIISDALKTHSNIYVCSLGNIGLARKYNLMYKEFPKYAAYALLNDDHIFRTWAWDRILLDKVDKYEQDYGHRLFILSWMDGWLDDVMPAGFCTKELLNFIKTPCPSGYMNHVFIDNVYQIIGMACDIHKHVPEVLIEHMHVIKGKAQKDVNYQQTAINFREDYDGFVLWLLKEAPKICRDIKDYVFSISKVRELRCA